METNRVQHPLFHAAGAENLAFRLVRAVLDVQRQVAHAEALCRELLPAIAAAGPPTAARPVFLGSATAPAAPPAAPRPAPPQPAGPRSAVAVDSRQAAKTTAHRKTTERTSRTRIAPMAAKRKLRQLDLDAGNDELAAVEAARRDQRGGF